MTALSILSPIGHNSSLPDNLLQHSAHTLAVGGRQLIALVEGARSGQGVAVFHRPIEHLGTRALQAEGAALLGDVLFYKHAQALVAVVYSNGVVLGHCCIVYRFNFSFSPLRARARTSASAVFGSATVISRGHLLDRSAYSNSTP